MAFASGIVHLAQLYVHGDPNFYEDYPKKTTPSSEKSPAKVVQNKLEEQRNLQSLQRCLKGGRVSSTSNKTTSKKVILVLPDAHKASQEKGEITILDLSTQENLKAFIYPSCMNWTIEMHLGKGKEETHSTVAWKAFCYIVFNYSSIPRRKDRDNENRIMARLCAQGAEVLEKKKSELPNIAKEIIKHPHLFPTFEALVPFIDHGSHHGLLNEALKHHNLEVLNCLLESDLLSQNTLGKLSWKEVATDCLKENPANELFAKIVNYLKPQEQWEFFNQLFVQKRWNDMAVFCRSAGFATYIQENNRHGEYDNQLQGIANFCVEDSQYLLLLKEILRFIQPRYYMELADKARQHGNAAAERFLLHPFSVPGSKARKLFPSTLVIQK